MVSTANHVHGSNLGHGSRWGAAARRSIVSLAACLAATMLSQPAWSSRYVFSTFKGDTAPGEKLSIYESSDALNFTLVSDTGFVGSSGTLRDPSIMKHANGAYYVAHTNPPTASCCGREDHFSIATSTDLVRWTELTTVAGTVPGAAHVWAPEWFVDDGVVYVIASIDTLNNDTDFKPYAFAATSADLKSFGPAMPLGIGPNYIDTFVIKVNGVYHAFTKNESTRYVEHATAARLLGPWTFVGTGNWSGFGSGMEGPNIVRLDNGTWRMFVDGQNSVGFLYADSLDLNVWSATKRLPVLADLVRHGTIFKEEIVSDASVPIRDGGTADAARRLDAAGSADVSTDTGDARVRAANDATANPVSDGSRSDEDAKSFTPSVVEAGSDAVRAEASVEVVRDSGGLPAEPTIDGGTSASTDGSGCGCRTAAPGPIAGGWTLAMLACVWAARQRARARRKAHALATRGY